MCLVTELLSNDCTDSDDFFLGIFESLDGLDLQLHPVCGAAFSARMTSAGSASIYS